MACFEIMFICIENEFIIEFVYSVVGQVHTDIRDIFVIGWNVFFGGETSQTFFVDIDT